MCAHDPLHSRLGQTSWFTKILTTGETVSRHAHQRLGGRRSMALEFTEAGLSPRFRGQGNTSVSDLRYQLIGVPLRLRGQRQLGYKRAKYIKRIELIENFDTIECVKGGDWEDCGYQWCAGI